MLNGDQNLRNEYDFGTPDPSTVNRESTSPGGIPPPQYNFGESVPNRQQSNTYDAGRANTSDLEIKVNDEGSYSPGEKVPNQSPSAFPAGPAAFGVSQTINITDDAFKPQDTTHQDGKHKSGGGKVGVMKDVLGIGKKSTSGKTDAEKEQIELERRWKNAQAESQRLDKLEERLGSAEYQNAESLEPAANFPPKFLCIRPFLYHSFSAVKPERQTLVKMAFWDWVASSIILVLNMVVMIITIAIPPRPGYYEVRKLNKALNIVLSIVFVIGIPISFFSWYWRIYRACCVGKPSFDFVSMLFLIVSVAWWFFTFVGPFNCGVCGIIYTIHVAKYKPYGLLAPLIIVLVLAVANACFAAYLVVRMFLFWRKDMAERRALRRAQKYEAAA